MTKPTNRPCPLGIHLDVTNRLWQAAMEKSVPFTYLNRPHWLALSAIAELGDGCNLKMIVSHLHSEVSTISRALKFLEENDLITKSVDIEDKRAKGVSMTPAGHKVLAQLDIAAQSVRTRLLANVSEEQLVGFIETLAAIRTEAVKILYGDATPESLPASEDTCGDIK
ncbi:MarR family winged helix-turn-helix transcriptional regulator [Enterobacillus tribolii]|uniref:MarR family transcriptional regulator for hemolysin n=1 Tax=Enterobacillus tribolii TaxID=1487935 RepID=A0A370QUJ4_9GAMM|nr:MarR family transcriptional regulator [Enterobacillus tribolii]MBW7981034.1 MarR family transcriptional regulator [Enterobacillus tribolii]RDK92908.1 MarR family transcriptional regulator for hemolysin [Enterobacillus tribolii]